MAKWTRGNPRKGRDARSGLSNALARGFSFMLAQTLLGKLARTGSQFALAWFLSPADFGIAAVALAAYAIASQLCVSPIEQKIVQLSDRHGSYVGEAATVSLVLGLTAGAALALLAVPLARLTGQAALPPLLWSLSAALPLNALESVPRASLTAQLRFGWNAAVSLGGLIAQSALMVALAWGGWGYYALVLPIVFVAPLTYLARLLLAPAYPRLSADRGKLMPLLSDLGWIWGAVLPALLIDRGVYFVGAHWIGSVAVGEYYLAYTALMQVIVVLSNNLANVLFPGFALKASRGESSTHQLVRAGRLAAVLTGGACLLIGVLAQPLVTTLLPTKWSAAAPAIQVLSIGLLGWPASAVIQAYLRAQGRFSTIARVNWVRLAVLTPVLVALAPLGLVWFTLGATTPYLIEPFLLAVALGSGYKKRASLLKRVFVQPTGVLLISTAPAFGVVQVLRGSSAPGLIQLGVGLTVFAASWVISFRIALPDTWRDGRAQLTTLLPGKLARLTGAPT
ncbi:MAG TPA: oligosaccharide flippase family protein [Gammaproteobacteria bacterium]|nr:oligosaccharide flippase family protein [Gammaproteobacteria bacterium]